jgi:hypothetical protein
MFLYTCMISKAAGIKTLVAGQVLKYNTAPARDGPLKGRQSSIALTAVFERALTGKVTLRRGERGKWEVFAGMHDQ